MTLKRNRNAKGSVEAYEDRGFLGDYGRNIPSNGMEPLARAIYRIGRRAYLSQTVRNALSFQRAIVKQAEEIYKTNRDDPAGYSRDLDAMVAEITGREAKDGAGHRPPLAEATKREHMVSIARNVEEENHQASQQIIRDLMGQSLNGMGVAIRLLSSDDGTIQSLGREGLQRLLSRTANGMATVDGHGNRLVGQEEEATFLQRFNGNIRSGVLGDRLSKCRSVEDVDNLVATVESGKLVVPQFRMGQGVEMDDQALKISRLGGGEGEHIMAMVDSRKFEIVRDGVTLRQLAVLRDGNDHTMLRGTTQPSVDAWFQDYGDAIAGSIASGNGEDAKRTIEYLARRTDRVPSQVVSIIRGAVASGDNAAIQVACPYVTAWHGENPASLARAFRDDGMTLLRMFSLANQMSTADTTSVGVRDRTLKTFSQPQPGEGRTATYERLAMDHGSDDALATMVSNWKNNGAGRNGPEETWDGSLEQVYLSPFFLGAMRERFRDYLEDSGGDIAAATRMMESTTSQLGISKLGTVPSPLMPYCPENYPGVADHGESMTNAPETIGKQRYGDLVADGRIPDGAQYVGTFLLSDAISESLAEDLDSNLRRGIDHITGEDGKKIFCPSYAHLITFSFAGLVHTMPIGRFHPSPLSADTLAYDPIAAERKVSL
jgi:hypothetical protein